jgi:hypothetical protein
MLSAIWKAVHGVAAWGNKKSPALRAGFFVVGTLDQAAVVPPATPEWGSDFTLQFRYLNPPEPASYDEAAFVRIPWMTLPKEVGATAFVRESGA